MTKSRSHLVLTALTSSALVLSIAACDKKEEPKVELAPSATQLAPSLPVAPQQKNFAFNLDPKGKTEIDMPAPKEHIKAHTEAMQGAIEVDVTNLKNTRGTIKVDLSTLTTSTFDDAKKNAGQTEHARTWLGRPTPLMRAANSADRSRRSESGRNSSRSRCEYCSKRRSSSNRLACS